MTRVAVLASGRGSNLQALIDWMEDGRLNAEIALVVSDNPEAHALERARKHNIPTAVITRAAHAARKQMDAAVADVIADHEADLVVLAGYMRILGRDFVARFYGKLINIHPSLLPAFPGLEAQGQALEYGVKVSGCTVHFVDSGVDTGPIILQRPVPVKDDDSVDALAARILEQEHEALPRAVRLFSEGRLRLEGRKVTILSRKAEGAK